MNSVFREIALNSKTKPIWFPCASYASGKNDNTSLAQASVESDVYFL